VARSSAHRCICEASTLSSSRWQIAVRCTQRCGRAVNRNHPTIPVSSTQDSTMISTPARNQQSPQSSLAGWPLAQQRFQRASRAARDSLAGRSLQRPSLASGPRAPAPAGVRPPETLPPLRPGAPARAWRVLRSVPRSAPRHPRASCGQSSYCWPQAQQLAAAAGTPQTRHRRRRHTSLGTALSRREAREGSCELDKRFDLTDKLDTGSTQARLILGDTSHKNSRASLGRKDGDIPPLGCLFYFFL
jgi:hypothetical protein